jgi:hypothetical protein
MKEHSGSVNLHTPGFVATIYTRWYAEAEPGVTREDKQYGII